MLFKTLNIVGKGENAGYQHFLHFPTMFSKVPSGASKVTIVRGLNRGIDCLIEFLHHGFYVMDKGKLRLLCMTLFKNQSSPCCSFNSAQDLKTGGSIPCSASILPGQH